MNNIEEQEDELIALASIYEDSFTAATKDYCNEGNSLMGGELSIHLDLPTNFYLLRNFPQSE